MKMGYLSLLLLALVSSAMAQAPLLLPTRSLAEELTGGARLGWKQLFLASSIYQPVEEAWLKDDFIPKFKKVLGRLRMKSSAEGFDCDNFSELFRNEMAIENRLAGRSSLGQVACALLVVKQKHAFGQVLATRDEHCLILVRTDNGWRVVEPQTLRVASLDKYPNSDTIKSVYF